MDDSRFSHFAKFHKNPLISLLYNYRLKRILNMVDFGQGKETITLDLGCEEGYFSYALSLITMTVGLDIQRKVIVESKYRKKSSNQLHFIVADVSSLPFRRHSIGTAICASILEHIMDLEKVIKEIRDILKGDAILIVGIPIETRFFRLIWKLISPREFRFIDQSQTYWCNPITNKKECYWDSTFTHKQDYQTIRGILRKYFTILRKEKLPLNIFPDFFSYYECIMCTPKLEKCRERFDSTSCLCE